MKEGKREGKGRKKGRVKPTNILANNRPWRSGSVINAVSRPLSVTVSGAY